MAKDKAKDKAKDNRDRTSVDLRGIRDRIDAVHQRFEFLRQMNKSQVIRTLIIHALDSLERQLSPLQTSVAYLVSQWDLQALAEESQLSVEALRRIREGVRPTDVELVDLARVLVKANGDVWTTHDLMAIREMTFPQSTTTTNKEKQPNGNGNGK